jgi:hypothetical protein
MAGFPQVDRGYDSILASAKIPQALCGDYRKWIRFYLHFCTKYGHDPAIAASLPQFIAAIRVGPYNLGHSGRTI